MRILLLLCLAWSPQLFAVEINGAYARATPPMASTAAVYIPITNTTADKLTLVQVKVAEDVAKKAELHITHMHQEVMRMRPLPMPVEIARGDSLHMAPGGIHIMFYGLTSALKEGDTLEVYLVFSHGSKQVLVPVHGMGHGHHHKHH